MTREELQKILDLHQKWVYGEPDGKRADLYGANLYGADLYGANLREANLYGANLYGADLREANLYGANLYGADLYRANLYGANLYRANLDGANLYGANLYRANLDENQQFRKGVILKENLIGYKKCVNGVIVELEIPKGAIVFSINGNKCRTNIAKCISISDDKKIAHSNHDYNFTYEVGKIYTIDNFNLMYNVECETGIHFFKTREEAERY